MGIEKKIEEVMIDHQAGELTLTLLNHVRRLSPPDPEEGEVISRILQDVIQDLPVREAMWTAFWLGAAWQSLRD